MTWMLKKNGDGWDFFEDEEFLEHKRLSFLSGRHEEGFAFESKEDRDEWLCEQEKKRLKKEALSLLIRRDHSSCELVEKLKKRGGSLEGARQMVESLQESGLVQDESYLERSILREFNRGYGPKMILGKLLQKKFFREAIERDMRRLLSLEMQLEKAEELAKKLFRQKNAAWPKVAAALARRGFSSEVLSKIRVAGISGKGDDIADIFHAGDE